jgi:hypothetical protein
MEKANEKKLILGKMFDKVQALFGQYGKIGNTNQASLRLCDRAI